MRLLDAAAHHLRPLLAFAMDTGGRRSELLKLDWLNVDLDRKVVIFTETKNGEDRTVRLTERALDVLKALGPMKLGPVFTFNGNPIKDVKGAFDTARRAAGKEDSRFHDLRYTFASRLVQKGVPIYDVMHLTGHKSMAMVQRYAHLAPGYQDRAIEALNAYGWEAKNRWYDLGTIDADAITEDIAQKEQNPLISQGVLMVEPDGIEPTTSTMPL